jgi:signal peptidase II
MFKNIKKMTALYSAVIFFVGLDRFLKILARQGYQFKIIDEILKFKYQINYYVAFSLPFHGFWLNAIICLIILLLIYYLARAWWGGGSITAISLFTIIMGAASNLLDRLKYGFVVDYLDLKYFTVFNLADIMIIAGVAGLLLTLKIKGKNYE